MGNKMNSIFWVRRIAAVLIIAAAAACPPSGFVYETFGMNAADDALVTEDDAASGEEENAEVSEGDDAPGEEGDPAFNDETAPEVTMGGGEAHKLSENFLFGIFSKTGYYMPYSVRDDESGTEGIWYSVPDIDEQMLSEEGEIDAFKIRMLVDEGDIVWTELFEEEGFIEIEDPGAVSGGACVVLIRARDNAGNETVCCSNGIIIEHIAPAAEITGISDDIYDKDETVSYTVKVHDGQYIDGGPGERMAVSGISHVITEVWIDGVCKERKVFYADAETGELSEDRPASEEKRFECRKYSLDMTLDDSFDSDDIVINVTAVDRAGNETTASRTVRTDRTSPCVSIEFDNNSASNGKYFRDPRTAAVRFTDRNFDRSKVFISVELEDGSRYDHVPAEELDGTGGIGVSWEAGSDMRDGGVMRDGECAGEMPDIMYVSFNGDNEYRNFDVCCEDKAGNISDKAVFADGTAAEDDFVIDCTDPVINVKYYRGLGEINAADTEEGRIYENGSITAVVSINEHDFSKDDVFAKGQIKCSLKAVDARGEAAETAGYEEQLCRRDSWSDDGDDHKFMVIFGDDANYTFSFEYTDLSGRSAVYDSRYFTVDKTPPVGSVTVQGGNRYSGLISRIYYMFFKGSAEVVLTGDDLTSPVRETEWYRSPELMGESELESVKEWNEGSSFRVSGDEEFISYLKVTDYAGNTAYFSSGCSVIVDSAAPEGEGGDGPVISIGAGDPGRSIYDSDVPVGIFVEDPERGGTRSGLSEVSCTVKSSGNTDAASVLFSEKFDPQERVRSGSFSAVIDSSVHNSNSVVITVTASDNAGNETTVAEEIRIDMTPPEISISFDDDGEEGPYYSHIRTAKITVRERNFDETGMMLDISSSEGSVPHISGWEHSADAGVSDFSVHTCSVIFSSDGDYSLSASCADMAGNVSLPVTAGEFTIDTICPVIKVDYDTNSENGYYNRPRTAVIDIYEKNFSPENVDMSFTALSDGKETFIPEVTEWETSGDRHRASVTYNADADYTFDISCSDLAGNAAQPYGQDRFTVDTVPPLIEGAMITDEYGRQKTAYGNEPVILEISITDLNFDTGRDGWKTDLVNLREKRQGTQQSDIPYTVMPAENGVRIRMGDFDYTKQTDGLYELTVHARDMADNSSDYRLMFSVNRFGAYYILDDGTRDLVENYYTDEEPEVIFTEYNLSTIAGKDSSVSYSRDGTSFGLTEGTDYDRSQVNTGTGVNAYRYVISPSNFSSDGFYDVSVTSRDSTGNVMTNKLNRYTGDGGRFDADITFIVDKTPPMIRISQIENGDVYRRKEHEAFACVSDNAAVKKVVLYIGKEDEFNGDNIEDICTPVILYDASDHDAVSAVSGYREEASSSMRIPFTVAENDGWQVIIASAEDMAGNVSRSSPLRVMVAERGKVPAGETSGGGTYPVPVFLLAAAFALSGGAVFIWHRQKHKKDPENHGKNVEKL